jgi:hypothetical protein
MKAKIYTPILLVAFLAGSSGAVGQVQTDKKEQGEKKQSETVIIRDGRRISGTELEKELQEIRQRHEEQRLKTQREAMESYKKSMEEFKKQGLDTNFEDFKVLPPTIRWNYTEPLNYYYNPETYLLGLKENSSLGISKNLADVTFASDFYYDVKEGNSTISFDVDGTMSAGELKIALKKPDGKTFQEFTISPLADVNWSQVFRWEEEDEDEFLGKWTIAIKADKATGSYNVKVNSR